jgi:hypothetical protein
MRQKYAQLKVNDEASFCFKCQVKFDWINRRVRVALEHTAAGPLPNQIAAAPLQEVPALILWETFCQGDSCRR